MKLSQCELIQDYPSIGQINEKLREFDIIPILAATSGASQFYMVGAYVCVYILFVAICLAHSVHIVGV